MNAGSMCKRVGAYHSLIRLHSKAGDLRHQLGSRHDLRGVDCKLKVKIVLARLHRHHDFFQCGVSGALTQAIDRALNLAGSANHHASQRVRHCHAEVVMAMHRPDRLIGIRHAFAQRPQHAAVQLRHAIADRIGKINRCRSFRDHCLNDTAQKIHVRTATIFRAEFNIVSKLACEANCLLRLFEHLIRRHAQFFLHMQWRRRDECVNALAFRRRQRFSSARNISIVCT